MESSIFFVNFIAEASLISKLVLLLLFLMSLYSWTVILVKFFQLKKGLGELNRFISFLTTLRSVEQLVNIANKKNKRIYSNLLRQILVLFIKPYQQQGTLKDSDFGSFERTVNVQFLKTRNHYRKNLSLLAIISSSAPFIGLFGTVVGIIKTFSEIALQKSTSLTVVAPGIAEALVATGFGIFVAIPSLIFFNFFSEKLRVLLENFEILSLEIFRIFQRGV